MNRSSDWQTFASGSNGLFLPEVYLLEEEDQQSYDQKEDSLQVTEAGLAILERGLTSGCSRHADRGFYCCRFSFWIASIPEERIVLPACG